MSYSYSIVEEPRSWTVYQHDSTYRYHLCLCTTKETAERVCNALVAHEGGELKLFEWAKDIGQDSCQGPGKSG